MGNWFPGAVPQAFSVIVPFESNYESSFLQDLDAIATVGLNMLDVIREAVRIAVSIVDFQDQNQITMHIDFTEVEYGIDAVVSNNQMVAAISSRVWEAFGDCVWAVYHEVYPHLRMYIESVGVRPMNSANGYRCDDVIVENIRSGADHFHVSFRIVNEPPSLSAPMSQGFISSV